MYIILTKYASENDVQYSTGIENETFQNICR